MVDMFGYASQGTEGGVYAVASIMLISVRFKGGILQLLL